jgi:hypothetical protein
MIHAAFLLTDDGIAARLYAFLKNNWRAMAADKKPLVVTVSEYKAKRSLEQNKYYWALLNQVAGEAWINGKQFSAEAWHELFKRQFIGMEELPNGDKSSMSSTSLSVGEFADYITQVERYASADLGLNLEQ